MKSLLAKKHPENVQERCFHPFQDFFKIALAVLVAIFAKIFPVYSAIVRIIHQIRQSDMYRKLTDVHRVEGPWGVYWCIWHIYQ